MEINKNQVADATFRSMGKGFQYLVQAPLFVIVGAIVAVWELINNLFQTIYQQGSQYAANIGASVKTEANQAPVKVPMMPIDNYSRLSIKDIVRRLEDLSQSDLQVVRQHERDNKNRAPILRAIDRKLT